MYVPLMVSKVGHLLTSDFKCEVHLRSMQKVSQDSCNFE